MLREPTAVERQRVAFEYLREQAINAHLSGDGLAANSLCHSGIYQVFLLSKGKNLLLSLKELSWMLILAGYWIVNPSERYALKQALEKIPILTDEDREIAKWLELHVHLIEQPLQTGAELFSNLSNLPWPTAFQSHFPETETLLTHLIELMWFRDTHGRHWKQVLESWEKRAVAWAQELFSKVTTRLLAQTRLTAPNESAPLYLESSIADVRSHSELAEVWLLNLYGRSADVCAAVERLTPRLSPDSHHRQVLGDFLHFNHYFGADNDSEGVHLARRRRISAETPLLIFHDQRDQQIVGRLGALYRMHSESMASERFAVFTLAMMHELSALRLWDYGMWIDAIRAQAEAILESMQWTNAHPEMSTQGLILAVRGGCAKPPEKDPVIRRAIDVLEFAPASLLQRFAGELLATYPKQKHDAAELLEDLTDLVPPAAWPELARWTVSYAMEAGEGRTLGWKLAPAEHWFPVLTSLTVDSPVWAILQPEALRIARIFHCWSKEETRAFLVYWLAFAPVPLAQEVAGAISAQHETDLMAGVHRAELLVEFEELRPEFHGKFTPHLLAGARSPNECLILARHLRESDLPAREEASRLRVISGIRETIARAIPPPETTARQVLFNYGAHLITQWQQEDIALLEELINAVNSPNVLPNYLCWLIQTIQLLVANGPVEFAKLVQQHVTAWTESKPLGRASSRTEGPFSTVHVNTNDADQVAFAIGWLAFQLPRKLGPDAHGDVLKWARQMLLSEGVRPLEMVIYGTATVAVQMATDRSVEPLSLLQTAIISLWGRIANADAAESLAGALNLLAGLLSTWVPGDPSSFGLQQLVQILERFLERFVKAPNASIRSSAAKLLWQLEQCPTEAKFVTELLAELRHDNRARVRFEAEGGWTAIRAQIPKR